jgi:predicted RNA-binding Zn ribbon-like protein
MSRQPARRFLHDLGLTSYEARDFVEFYPRLLPRLETPEGQKRLSNFVRLFKERRRLHPPGDHDFWFDPVLSFVNAEDPGRLAKWLTNSLIKLDGYSRTLQLAQGGRRDAGAAQQMLRETLEQLRKQGTCTPKIWASIFGDHKDLLLAEAQSLVFLSANRPKEFGSFTEITATSVSQWALLALAELISQGFDDRVRRCALETCNKWFIDSKSKGPRREYCSVSHGSQDRVKRKRRRDARR